MAVGFSAGLAGTNMVHGIVTANAGGGGAAVSNTGIEFVWHTDWRNDKLHKAIRRIEARSTGRRLTPGEGTIEMIREARDGGMYGLSANS